MVGICWVTTFTMQTSLDNMQNVGTMHTSLDNMQNVGTNKKHQAKRSSTKEHNFPFTVCDNYGIDVSQEQITSQLRAKFAQARTLKIVLFATFVHIFFTERERALGD